MKYITIILFISALLAGCATSQEYVQIDKEFEGWKVGFETRQKSFGDTSYIREFIPADDSIDDWTKIITIQFIDGKSHFTPKQLANSLVNGHKETCPAIEWDIIESDERSIMYEWHTDICDATGTKYDPNIHVAQHEITRIYYGNDGMHKASYAEKTKALDPTTRQEWVSILRETNLMKDGQIVNLQ